LQNANFEDLQKILFSGCKKNNFFRSCNGTQIADEKAGI